MLTMLLLQHPGLQSRRSLKILVSILRNEVDNNSLFILAWESLKPRSKAQKPVTEAPSVRSKRKRSRSGSTTRNKKAKKAKSRRAPRAPNIDVDGSDEGSGDNKFNESGDEAADGSEDEEKSSGEEECDSPSLGILKAEVDQSSSLVTEAYVLWLLASKYRY